VKNKYLDHTIHQICNSFDKNEPFSYCAFCNREFKENELYFVEKAFKHHVNLKASDIILEYALCNPCMEEIRANLSIDSKQRIESYFENNLNPDYMDAQNLCCVHGESIYDADEYQVIAVCRDGKLEAGARPLILGTKAMEEVQELLSAQTKEELNDFFDRITDLPPELKRILKQGDYFVL
jgi:hypothetical protein